MEYFHPPEFTDHGSELGSCFAAEFMGSAMQRDGHFRLAAFLGRAVIARALIELRKVRKGADPGVHGHKGDFPINDMTARRGAISNRVVACLISRHWLRRHTRRMCCRSNESAVC